MSSHRYPDLGPSTPPTSAPKASTTARILKPGIVMAAVVLLIIASVPGMVVGVGILGGRHVMGVLVANGFVVVASSLGISYVLFHFLAAYRNEPVGIVRPPKLRLHAACFIFARIGLVLWIITMIVSSVVASRPNICGNGGRDCRTILVGVVVSSLAFIATGTILTALEACPYPFQSPEVFHVARKVSVLVSSFDEELLERSASNASSFDPENAYVTEKKDPSSVKESIRRKPLPVTPSVGSQMSEVSEPQRPTTPLLPMEVKTRARDWGEEWAHLVNDTRRKGLTHSDSAVSGLSSYMSSESSELSVSKSERQPRTVTPSSSISNLSKRSPLATMRSADYPDVVVRPSLRYCPPIIPAPHEWNPFRTASLSQLLPVADVHSLQRRSMSMGGQQSRMIRRPSRTLPTLANHQRRPPLTARRSCDIKVPGAYIDFYLNLELEQHLEHADKIEAIALAQSKSGREVKIQAPRKDQVNGKREEVMVVDSKLRYRDKRPVVPSLQTRVGQDISQPHVAKESWGKENLAKDKRFKRLSLGDMIDEFDKMFDVY
ncbi:hypothetical protein LOCC1_G007934 [Lachnellula occidentalis]|uniref:Transmembrane protein n=1 Tax=Lachnellula occidentalis TaxID=215460 RepID=A0A8H8RE13_9HELO|nr:hypothetical protein LOCC1_G007934 [Lachnellula occidentalis]